MGRVLFGRQDIFLRNLKTQFDLSTAGLALLCNVSPRTFRDWLKGKYNISEKALQILCKKFQIPFPQDLKVVDDYWYAIKGARKGALRRMELYGTIGTPEGRIKGGINSQLRRKEDPEKYRLAGCNLRKNFLIIKPCRELAEVVGIILGDGGITKNQLKVTLSSLVDLPYSAFVISLFTKAFGEKPTYRKCICCNSIVLTLSGLELVKELKKLGLVSGNKVKNQVDFPSWIWSRKAFQVACVRGLMDTDGGCYFHRHTVNGLTYRNFGMSFANKSLPIVQSVAKVLKSLELKYSLASHNTKIYIYSLKKISKYFKLVGSNNPKNIEKFQFYINQSSHRI